MPGGGRCPDGVLCVEAPAAGGGIAPEPTRRPDCPQLTTDRAWFLLQRLLELLEELRRELARIRELPPKELELLFPAA